MKRMVIFFFMMCSLVFAKEQTFHIKLEVNSEKIIEIEHLKGISNAGDIVEDVVLEGGNSFLLRGISWGNTQVTAWDSMGNHYIYQIEVLQPKFVKELKAFLSEIEGVNVNFLGRNIIVEGQLLRKSDLPKLNGILTNFPQVKNMVNMDIPETKMILQEAVKAEIYNHDAKFTFLGDGLMFEGKSLIKNANEEGKKIASLYFPSSYPALEITNVTYKMKASLVEIDVNQIKDQNDPFSQFIQASRYEKKNKLLPYTFYRSSSHGELLEKVLSSTRSSIVKNWEEIESVKNQSMMFKIQNGQSVIQFEFVPQMMELSFIDTRLNISFFHNGRKEYWYTDSFILKSGQGLACVGFYELMSNYLNPALGSKLNQMNEFKNSGDRIVVLIFNVQALVND